MPRDSSLQNNLHKIVAEHGSLSDRGSVAIEDFTE
ncbi:hypothetical protein FHW77_004860 [Agrobacterium sp. RC10-4-1]|nr:hypothetical protein [Agrobacterium sp. RC10-4-1]